MRPRPVQHGCCTSAVPEIPTKDEIRALLREERRALLDELDGRIEPYLNSESAAVFLDTTVAQVRWLVAHRDLPYRRAQGERRGRLLFKASELQQWVEERPS